MGVTCFFAQHNGMNEVRSWKESASYVHTLEEQRQLAAAAALLAAEFNKERSRQASAGLAPTPYASELYVEADGPGPKDPTPEEIREATALIRQGWSDAERASRSFDRRLPAALHTASITIDGSDFESDAQCDDWFMPLIDSRP